MLQLTDIDWTDWLILIFLEFTDCLIEHNLICHSDLVALLFSAYCCFVSLLTNISHGPSQNI